MTRSGLGSSMAGGQGGQAGRASGQGRQAGRAGGMCVGGRSAPHSRRSALPGLAGATAGERAHLGRRFAWNPHTRTAWAQPAVTRAAGRYGRSQLASDAVSHQELRRTPFHMNRTSAAGSRSHKRPPRRARRREAARPAARPRPGGVPSGPGRSGRRGGRRIPGLADLLASRERMYWATV
jgi:hypothetical protein